MRIVVSGASGLVGRTLCPALEEDGHQVVRLVRRAPAGEGEVHWDPAAGHIDEAGLAGCEAAVHLAGENIGTGRWGAAKKERILKSRSEGTALLVGALAKLDPLPKVLVSASAVGIYGDRGDESLDEESAPGNGFLAEVCQAWEQATAPLEEAGVRVVRLRFGVILSSQGGALEKMLLPFKLCVGGVVGSGKQYMSWLSLPDAVGAVRFALGTDSLSGPVNVTAPAPATNREFTKTLGKVLGRPTILPLPAFAARLVLGEMGEELLLSGQRVLPKVLQETGFEFRHPELEAALRDAVG